MAALLRSKIQLPPLRQQHIERERVLHLLTASATARLILLAAPAGFGKSTALIQWAHTLRDADTRVAWYALDAGDNDPARFAAYLLGACRALPGPLAALPDPDLPVDLNEAVNHVLNAAVDSGAPLVLMLDDYHLLNAPQIHDAVGRMCEYMPPNMRLAIGTRADPPLQLARLRARRAVTELRMADLRFSRDEVARWLEAALGWQPAQDLLQQLDTLTEGWAAALALIMIGADARSLEDQLARYSQARRHIFEYLAQEILDHQPAEIRRFLLDTCVLDRLEPALCSALTDQPGAALLLTRLAGASLFIIPLSDTEPVYRYHHLFAGFLRQYLEMDDRERYRHQHRRAAVAHAAAGEVVAAVDHALAGEDTAQAARLIEQEAWAVLTSRGEIMTIIHWLPRFPEAALTEHPRLCLYFSRALYLTGDIARSEAYVQLADDAIERLDSDHADQRALRAITRSYQATLAAYRGDVATGLRRIAEAERLQDTFDDLDRVRFANTNAFLRYLSGDVPAARAAYEVALDLAARLDHDYLMLDAHSYLAQIDLLAGDLSAVEARCEALLARYPSRIAPLSAVMLPLATARYQRNRLVDAETLLRDAIALAQSAHIPDVLWSAHVTLTNVLLARGAVDEAESAIAGARRYAGGFHSPMMASYIAAAEARILLRAGQIDEALDWAQRYRMAESDGYHKDFENITLAQIHLAQGEADAALAALAQVIADAVPAGRTGYILTAELLRALAHRQAGDDSAALDALERALDLARPRGFVRLFLDAGPPMTRLLSRAVEQGRAAEYAAHLLRLSGDGAASQHPAETLTEREIEVLEHIAAGASNQAIADALVISVGTVKSHIHHIMGKLDAQNRTEAVSKARRLHIIPD
jgi:LuxR family maltose regulon positive regulatory protein